MIWVRKPEILIHLKTFNFSFSESSELHDFLNPAKRSEVCGNQRDIFDANGKYVKTACAVFHEKLYDKACVDDGMRLFIIESAETEQGVLNFATDMFGHDEGTTLWVNGKRDCDGSWHTYGPEKKPLVNGIKGITDEDNEKSEVKKPKQKRDRVCRVLDDCLALFGHGVIHAIKWSCQSKMYSICEFKKS